MKLVECRRIFGEAPHSAFTDLVRFQDAWFCAFREGASHISLDGNLRVITSQDGWNWTPAASFRTEVGDYRDAKLSVTASGKLLLSGALFTGAEDTPTQFSSVTWLSSDGTAWEGPFYCPSGHNTWRWSVTWCGNYGYSIGYTGKDTAGCLYRTADGIHWEEVARPVFPDPASYPNETSLWFGEDETLHVLLRVERDLGEARLGRSRPPYIEWHWRGTGLWLGGPKLFFLPDGRRLAVGRLAKGQVRTSLCLIEPGTDQLREVLTLPSGGDTSYAGVVLHEGMLWISYYSSHESKTAVYLAKVDPG